MTIRSTLATDKLYTENLSAAPYFWAARADLRLVPCDKTTQKNDLQFGLSPGNFSTIQPEVYIWTPNLETNYKGLIDVKASKTADGYIIEARIPLKVLYSDLKKIARASPEVSKTLPKRFSKGMRLGISVDPSDTDSPAAPQKLMMSTSRNRAWGDPTTFGILELK